MAEKKPLDETLKDLLKEADGKPILLRKFVTTLKGRGIPVFLMILSLPFCLPIQIPGTSTPFGIALALLGARMMLNRKMWWPKWLLNKQLSYKALSNITKATIKWFGRAKKLVHPRLVGLVQNPLLHRLHGLFIIIMALLLAIPIPVPFTNLLSAFPIFFMGLARLEDDGYVILLSYFIGLLAILFWASLFFFGGAGFHKILSMIKLI